MPEGDGTSLRTHLERRANSTNLVDDRLLIELPPFANALWVIFNGLARPSSMGGISKISQQEIAAYQFNYDIKLNSFELEMIELIDGIAIEVFSKVKS